MYSLETRLTRITWRKRKQNVRAVPSRRLQVSDLNSDLMHDGIDIQLIFTTIFPFSVFSMHHSIPDYALDFFAAEPFGVDPDPDPDSDFRLVSFSSRSL
jgi:hypothetical protein